MTIQTDVLVLTSRFTGIPQAYQSPLEARLPDQTDRLAAGEERRNLAK